PPLARPLPHPAPPRTVRPHRPSGRGHDRRRLGRGSPPAPATAAPPQPRGRASPRLPRNRRPPRRQNQPARYGPPDPNPKPAVREAATHLVSTPAGLPERAAGFDNGPQRRDNAVACADALRQARADSVCPSRRGAGTVLPDRCPCRGSAMKTVTFQVLEGID